MGPSGEDKPRVGGVDDVSRRDSLVAVASLALLGLLFYAPILSGFTTFPDGDFTHHFLPFSQHVADAWRTRTLPLWNPHTYSGHPFWADVQAAVLYPLSTLMLLATLPFRSAAARFYFLEIEAVLHVLLAGWFTFLLARQLTGRVWAAALGGIAFMLSGYVTGYPPLQLSVLRTAVWLPLLLWLLLRAWREPNRWRYWVGAAVAFAAAFLAGHTQTFMYTAYAVAGWIVVLALGRHGAARGDGGNRGSGAAGLRMAGLAAFVLLTAGLVAAQLLPSVEFSRFVRARERGLRVCKRRVSSTRYMAGPAAGRADALLSTVYRRDWLGYGGIRRGCRFGRGYGAADGGQQRSLRPLGCGLFLGAGRSWSVGVVR